MNNLEIRKAAVKLYWAHSTDVSEYDEADGAAILADLSIIRAQEDRANEIIDRRFAGDIEKPKGYFKGYFSYGL